MSIPDTEDSASGGFVIEDSETITQEMGLEEAQKVTNFTITYSDSTSRVSIGKGYRNARRRPNE